jgi:hypothetical protein
MKQKKMTKAALLKEVYQMDPTLKQKQNEETRDAVLLLCGALVDGPNNANKTAKIPEVRRRKFMKNLRANKVFVGNTIYADWDDPETGGVAIMMDACIALGWMQRAKDWCKEKD